MEILYFSMSCDAANWEAIQSESKIKASPAPHIFDTSLLKGIKEDKNIKIKVLSFPSIATYPGSKKIFLINKREKLFPGFAIRWLPFINLPFIKQITFSFSTLLFCFVWLFKNRKKKEKQIVMYTTYFPIAIPIVFSSKIFNCKCTTIITDIPEHLFLNQKKAFKKLLIFYALYTKMTIFAQSRFDKYVFLTSEMNTLINKKRKPFIILEGICDPKLFDNFLLERKSKKKVVMYAGALNKKLGIALLLEVFNEIREQEIEFWIFGSGDFEDEIARIATINNQIKFFGKVDRDTVLKYERRATLLINIRDTSEDFTKYSFPSKTIEYMCSGTPLLTSKLAGIPEEYYEYVYTIKSLDKTIIRDEIIRIISKDPSELCEFGKSASHFVKSKKNYLIQSAKIVALLKS